MMTSKRQSDIFEFNFYFWKVFGLWSGRGPNEFYKYYSFFYLFVTLFVYNILLTLNLAFTPRTVEVLIREVIFYFTEIAVTSKVFMIIIMRDKILVAFDLMDGKEFEGEDEICRQIIEKDNTNFKTFWKLFATISHLAYSSLVFIPLIIHIIFQTEHLALPVCKYYFLTDDLRDNYFVYWFIYQSWGMYGHMTYNVTCDSFIAGLLLTAISQLKILNAKLRNLKLSDEEQKVRPEVREKIQMHRLRKCFARYDTVLAFITMIQEIMNITMFIVFGISSLIICVVMCGLILPSSTETYVFLVMYLIAMTLQIFIPGYLGTQLNYESTELVYAAYCTEWIPRSESFKKNIKFFMQRATIPIQMTGLKILPLTLSTFTSIIKSAYSFFTVIGSFQED